MTEKEEKILKLYENAIKPASMLYESQVVWLYSLKHKCLISINDEKVIYIVSGKRNINIAYHIINNDFVDFTIEPDYLKIGFDYFYSSIKHLAAVSKSAGKPFKRLTLAQIQLIEEVLIDLIEYLPTWIQTFIGLRLDTFYTYNEDGKLYSRPAEFEFPLRKPYKRGFQPKYDNIKVNETVEMIKAYPFNIPVLNERTGKIFTPYLIESTNIENEKTNFEIVDINELDITSHIIEYLKKNEPVGGIIFIQCFEAYANLKRTVKDIEFIYGKPQYLDVMFFNDAYYYVMSFFKERLDEVGYITIHELSEVLKDVEKANDFYRFEIIGKQQSDDIIDDVMQEYINIRNDGAIFHTNIFSNGSIIFNHQLTKDLIDDGTDFIDNRDDKQGEYDEELDDLWNIQDDDYLVN